MNKIYRVIWSKVRNCYVVVSEIAKAHSKGGSTVRHVPRMGAVLTTILLASVLSFGISAPVWAGGEATIPVVVADGDSPLVTIKGGEGIGVVSDAIKGTLTISAEKNDTLELLKKYMKFNTTYPDSTSVVLPVVDDRSKSSFALGQGTQISVLSGDENSSINNLAIGTSSKIFGNTDGSNIVIGASAVTGYYSKSLSESDGIFTKQSTAIGFTSRVYGSQGIAIGQNAQVGTNNYLSIKDKDTYKKQYIEAGYGIAIGSDAKAYSEQSTAIGPSAVAGSNSNDKIIYDKLNDVENKATAEATAVGYSANATAKYSTALGTETTASDQKSSAIGYKAQATNSDSTALGASSKATNVKSVAIGSQAEASGLNSIAIGSVIGDTLSNNTKIIAKGQYSVAIGASAQANNSNSTAIGANTRANQQNTTAIGNAAKAFGQNSSAIGTSTIATGKNNVSIGVGSEARKYETMALGFHAAAIHSESIAVGHDTVSAGDSSLAIGHLALTGMPVKEGTKDVFGSQYKFVMLPTNSKISGASMLYYQTSDGTVLLHESNSSGGENEGTFSKVKAFPIDSEGNLLVDSAGNIVGNENDIADWRFEKVDADDKPVSITHKPVVTYKSNAGYEKDVRDPQFESDHVKHINYYYQVDKSGKEIEGTRTNPLDGGMAVGSYTVAQGEHSMALGLTSSAFGNNSVAQGLYANAYGEGAIAFGHESLSGAHVKIDTNANIEDVHTTSFSVSKGGEAERVLLDGSVAKVDKNSIYTIENGKIEVNSNGVILKVNGSKFGYDANNIKLKKSKDDIFTVKRDDATGYYYYENSDGKTVTVKADEILTFTGLEDPTKPVDIAAGKMTLSSGGISFGSYAHAEGDKSLAIGRVAGAYGRNSAAVGRYANAYGAGAVALGHNAVTGAQVTDDADGNKILKLSADGTGIPVTKSGSATEFVEGGVAIGSFAHALGDQAVSIGLNTGAFGDNSSVIGPNSEANGKNAVAIGSGSVVAGDDSIAIGTGHTVSGSNSGAFGDPTTISGNNSYSVGNNNMIDKDLETDETATDVFAVGNSITTVTSNSAFLGDNAAYVQAAAKLEDGTTGGLKTVEKANINGFEFGSFAGAAPVGVVSVGTVGDKAQRRIQNVAAGLISAASTDAINGSQLYAAIDAMQFDIVGGDNVEVIKETSNGHTKYTIHSLNAIVQAVPNNTVTVEDEVGTGATNGKTTDLTPESTGSDAGNGTGAGTTSGTTVTTPEPTPSQEPIGPLAPNETKPNNHTTTYTVDAADSKVAGVEVKAGESKTTANKTETDYTVTVTSNEQNVEDNVIKTTVVPQTATFTVTDTRNRVVAGDNITVTASGDDEKGPVTYTISAKAATNVKVIKGEHTTVTPGKDGDFTTYAVNVMTDGKVASGDNGIVTGDTVYKETRVEKDGNYIKKDNTAAENITALDEKVKDNATGIENLNNEFNNTYNQMNRLDDRMRKGLAGAAALAALHPMDFDPDDKLQFSAGVGNYRSETAAAIGAFYRPDENVMFSIGGTFGNSDNLINAGITFGLDGNRNRIPRSRNAMAHEIVELKEHIARQDEQIAKQDEQIAKLTELVNKLAGKEQQAEKR